jgi:uridine kinase
VSLVDAVREAARTTRPLLVAFDGRSGTGKSTVAATVAAALDAAVVEGDDFYAGGTRAEWSSWSPEERAAHCIDWRRLRREALEPLLAGHTTSWHPFDWDEMTGLADAPRRCHPRPIVILDGVYSSRPELSDLVGLSVLFRVPDDVRERRILARDGDEFDPEWQALWDSAERFYFEQIRPSDSFDLTVDAE